MRALIVLSILAVASAARADDQVAFGPPGPDEPAALLTAIGVGVTNEGPGGQWLVEAAYRPVDHVPLRAHAMFAKGSGDFEDYGSTQHWELRGGVEAAACGGSGVFCWVLDVDAGMLRQHAADYGPSGQEPATAIDRYGFLLGARGGFDAGNRTVRFRLMLDIAGALRGPFLIHDTMGSTLDLANVSSLEAEIVLAF